MANRIKGEVPVRVGDKVWVLVVDFNMLCTFEEATGMIATKFISQVESGEDVSFRALRHFIHAMMIARQPDATLEDAGDLLSTDPDALNRALSAAFPSADQDPSPPGKAPAATD